MSEFEINMCLLSPGGGAMTQTDAMKYHSLMTNTFVRKSSN